MKVYLGRTDNNLCPVAAVVAYLALRHKLGAGPFFKFQSGTALTRASFVNRVRKALKEAGMDADKFSGHSFRIGAASTAAAGRSGGLSNKNVGEVGKFGIPLVHSSPKGPACRPVSGTGQMRMVSQTRVFCYQTSIYIYIPFS